MKRLAALAALFLLSCAATEPLTVEPDAATCAPCFETCNGKRSDVEARHCVWDCLQSCAAERDE